MSYTLEPVILTGKFVRLEPMTPAHLSDLARVGLDDNIWKYMLYGQMHTPDDLRAWIELIIRKGELGADQPFVVIHQGDGRAVGCTRYMNMEPRFGTLEIGGTWYGADYQRTGVNSETKYLLLRHAFEHYGCMRVQIKTDLRNERSQRAIERLGAVKEGVLRNHMLLPDGSIRHSVMYSIIDSEWPAVKARLEGFLAR